MWRLASVLCLCACLDTSSIQCESGLVCGFDAICDEVHGGCIVQEQLDTCRGMTDGTTCETEVTGPGVCDASVCLGQRCGDGYRATEEMCDGSEFATISNCQQLGFYDDVPIGCNSMCELDTSMCTGTCGDSVVNGREQCDGSAPTTDCVGFGFGTGVIDCVDSTCAADLGGCIPFGWRTIPMAFTVRSIGGTSSSNVWVGGDGGMVRRFDGTSWSSVDISACTQNPIDGVAPVSATEAFLFDQDASGDGVIRVSATGCTRTTIPNNENLHAVWATSATDAYVASDGADVYRFDGTNWVLANPVRARFIWGSGSHVFTGSIFRPDVQHFDGISWSSIAVPGISRVWGIWGTSADDFYVGAGDTSDQAIVKRFRTGTGWTTELDNYPLLEGTTDSSVGGGSIVGGRTVAVGTKSTGRSYVLGSDGTGWIDLGVELGQAGSTYMAPDGALYVAAVGTDRVYFFEGTTRLAPQEVVAPVQVFALGTGSALATVGNPPYSIVAWNGTNWGSESNANANVNDMMVDPTGNVFVASLSGSVMGLRQRTGPNTYVDVTDIKGRGVAGTSATDLWVITLAAQSKVTHWNGVSADEDTVSVTNPSLLLALSPSLVFALGDNGTMSRFSGSTWSTVTSPLTTLATGVTRTSASEGWAWNATELAHFVNDTWTSFVRPPGSLRDLVATPDTLLAATSNGLFFYSGAQWVRVDSGTGIDNRSVDVRGDAIYFTSFGRIHQIHRTSAW